MTAPIAPHEPVALRAVCRGGLSGSRWYQNLTMGPDALRQACAEVSARRRSIYRIEVLEVVLRNGQIVRVKRKPR